MSDATGSGEQVSAEVLAGGVANAGAVVRIGDEVRRPAGPHTPAVFALLRHLREAGFEGAPEPLGLDDQGRERLRYLAGDVPVPPYPAWSQTDACLASAADLLRRLHLAVAGFRPPPGAVWDTELAWPAGGPIVGHNDACPENVVCRDGKAVALVDFDFAAPTDPLYDLSQLARMWIPMETQEDAARLGRAPFDAVGRLRVVADAYRLDFGPERERFLDIIVTGIHRRNAFVRARMARGEQAFIDMWNATGGEERVQRRVEWIDANRPRFAAALARR